MACASHKSASPTPADAVRRHMGLQHITCMIFMQMLFAILAAVGVYLLVPRGISIGEVQLQSDHMSWNTTRGTYQLKLLAKIPIYNPNYMKVC